MCVGYKPEINDVREESMTSGMRFTNHCTTHAKWDQWDGGIDSIVII